ncbi:MAG TPA: HAMP domain-containing protein [Candidatus Desulfofervidus auxilii]|uniref:histidine kinase n=1 Tax=Desulfofervidus auxilii TaxID=1621989 RepID=A0A7C0Y626_DESA2|nr:HAMP domain-containing protein [Candidatus Desulfofervidus auxilii]
MSLKGKFVLIFLIISLIPLLLGAGASYYHLKKIHQLFLSQTVSSLRDLGEILVEQKVEDIVRMLDFYIQTQVRKRPGEKINWDELQYDPVFIRIAVQTVGKTGYSSVQKIENGKISIFAHPNPKFIGIDINTFKKSNPDFWRIIKGPKPGERFSKGYYPWKEPNGRVENKFTVVMPVPDTPLTVAATIYTKEVEAPLKSFEKNLLSFQKQFLWQFLLGGAIIVILVIVIAILFALHLVKPILHLTDVAERISLGELNVPIEITSTDEIGDLADALRRMQASLRKAIQRLQRRQKI